jgi:7,8-dihydroneopterin aldolase/epimerase/oxygenase
VTTLSGPSTATGVTSRGDDQIQLRGLRVVGTHGVLPEERSRAQPFEVDIDLDVDLAPAASSDRLADTVDYGGIAGIAAGIIAGSPSYRLLEALAGAVADAALSSDPRITAVTVSLRKLQAPLAVDISSVGVRITRQR